MGMITTLEHLKYLKNSQPIALCHGVFDVLHEGHLNYLEEAKRLCPTVVVSVTSDRFVNKGPGRPHFNHSTRARMLAALDIVDFVYINDAPRATQLIKEIAPKLYVKGVEYTQNNELTQGIEEEIDAVRSVGGEVRFIDKPTQSSSHLLNRFFNSFNTEQNDTLAKIKSIGGIDKIYSVFKEIEKLKVTIVGEPIVDTYVFCTPEGISSKSPTVSARYNTEENYAGGALAVANHVVDFVDTVNLYSPHGKESYFQTLRKNQVDRRILYHENIYSNYITPRKTRYIDQDKNQRIFELTNIIEDIWKNNDPRNFIDDIRNSSRESEITLLCDFGHGLFENGFLSGCFDLSGMIALNCQTNSSNFGFNPYTKHKNFHYLSIDLKEARVAFHDRLSDSRCLFDKISATNVSMTLGANGAIHRQGNYIYKSPAFSNKVIDPIGAGDAYYAITSLMVKVGAPVEIIPFVGNVFAGLKTNIIGNKFSVTKTQLFKTINAILK